MTAKKHKRRASQRDPFSGGVNMGKAMGAVTDLASLGIVSATATNVVASLKK